MNKRGFASDNNAGVHPEVLKAMVDANKGHTIAYGDDVYTESALKTVKDHFGQEVEVFFVFLGTAANVLGLTAATNSFHSILCAETSHIQEDECGAPEKFSGCKLIPLPTADGKITPDKVGGHLYNIGFEHHSQPKIVSITQSTELGTVYTLDELKTLADFCHSNNMLLHMDGARLANAAVALGMTMKEITTDAGVDILSFGGTKNGMMYGEAIVFHNPELAANFKFIRKQGMQLASKMRFISVQFEALLKNSLWRKNAEHANRMAAMLATEVSKIDGIKLTQKVEANGVFAILPKKIIPKLQDEYFFYVWDEVTSEVRWMTSFDTQEEDVDTFVKLIKQNISSL